MNCDTRYISIHIVILILFLEHLRLLLNLFCFLFTAFVHLRREFVIITTMTTCVLSPLSTNSTPKETPLIASPKSLSCNHGSIELPMEIAGLRSAIVSFENTDPAIANNSNNNNSNNTADLSSNRSGSANGVPQESTPKKSKRHCRRVRLGKQFSTTSTVLARNTITNPNFSQVNYWYVLSPSSLSLLSSFIIFVICNLLLAYLLQL